MRRWQSAGARRWRRTGSLSIRDRIRKLEHATKENLLHGYFRDKLYYITTSERLDLGYMDFPPLVALVTNFARHARRLAGAALWCSPVYSAEAAGSPRTSPRSRSLVTNPAEATSLSSTYTLPHYIGSVYTLCYFIYIS